MLRPSDYTKALLIDVAWFEASAYGLRPMQMVAQAIANRVRLGWGAWHEVLCSLGQFSAITPAARAERWLARALPDPANPNFQGLLRSVDVIYDNTFENLARGGVYWANLNDMSRIWFLDNIVAPESGHNRVVQQGTFTLWD